MRTPTLPPLAERRTAVYRLFAADGELLYVGISCDLKTRLSDHRCHKVWWPDVDRIAIDWHVNRASALDQEAQAATYEKPRHNVLRPDPRKVRASDTEPASVLPAGGEDEITHLGLPVQGHVRTPLPDDPWASSRAAWGPHGLASSRRHRLRHEPQIA